MFKINNNVRASIHDGLMIEKNNKIIINDDFLNTCSKYICGETGYNVEIIENPMIIDNSLVDGDVESYD
jgi:hypothetical protein